MFENLRNFLSWIRMAKISGANQPECTKVCIFPVPEMGKGFGFCYAFCPISIKGNFWLDSKLSNHWSFDGIGLPIPHYFQACLVPFSESLWLLFTRLWLAWQEYLRPAILWTQRKQTSTERVFNIIGWTVTSSVWFENPDKTYLAIRNYLLGQI